MKYFLNFNAIMHCLVIVIIAFLFITTKFLCYRILGDLPNTYAFTKALGEGLAVEQLDNLPLIVLRPSIGKYHKN